MRSCPAIIINADDFGLNSSCTRAICDAFEKRLITDTTIVANGTAWEEALLNIREYHLEHSVGIHFNLTDGVPLTDPIRNCAMFTDDGYFTGRINRLQPLTNAEKKAVYDELTAQIEKIRHAGIELTHADSHHHIHTAPFIAPIFARVCKEHGISKIRLHRNIGKIPGYKRIVKTLFNRWLHWKGIRTTAFFGSVDDIQVLLPGVGVTEIMVHPGYNFKNELIDIKKIKNGICLGENLESRLSALTGQARTNYDKL